MIPDFGRIFDEPIPAYFVMLMVGFAVSIGIGVRWAKQSKLDHDVIIDLGLVSLIAGVAGARVLHVLVDGYFWDYVHLCTDPAQVSWHISHGQCTQYEGLWDAANNVCHPAEGDCFAWAKFWQGGLVWYGGLIGAGAYAMRFLHRNHFPIGKAIDYSGNVLPLGVFFGRLGCWFGGCCFGIRSDHWSAVSFPPGSPASEAQFREGLLPDPGYDSLRVLPTQLYEAAGCLAIAAFCMFVVHPRKRFDGQVFCVSMIAYAVLRFALEFVRADDRGGLLGISTSQWIALAFVGSMIGLWVYMSRRAKAALAADGPRVPDAQIALPEEQRWVGSVEDGRALVDLRRLTKGKLAADVVAKISEELAREQRKARVVLVDAAVLDAWAGPKAISRATRALSKFTKPGDEIWIAHDAAEPPVDANQATVFLLRSLGLEVRPFAIRSER